MNTTKPKLLGLAGSLRVGSNNRAVLQALAAEIDEIALLTVFDLKDIPLYNGDIERGGIPDHVAGLKRAIEAADGLVIATPEYSHGIPGVLKNALDWAARPAGKSSLSRKPVLTLSSSPALTGGVRAQAQLNETILACGGRLLSRPQCVIPFVTQKMVDGVFMDRSTLDFLVDGVRHLITETDRA